MYKNMGVQENQNCTAITMRMKHRRMRWSVHGANNMAKALYRKENRELIDTIERYTDGEIFTMQMEEIVKNAERGESAKEGWKRESICRDDYASYAAIGRNADSIEESPCKSILLKRNIK